MTHELGIPADDILVQHGDTDNTPFGMGTYASRSTPTAGAATAMVARKVRAKAKKLAAHLLEVSEEDVEWELGRFYVRSAPNRGVTITDCAFAAYTNMPDGLEPGLENNAYYDPPNMTWPFDVYITTVEVDLTRHLVDRLPGADAEDLRPAGIDRQDFTGESVLLEEALRPRRGALFVGRSADQRDALGFKQRVEQAHAGSILGACCPAAVSWPLRSPSPCRLTPP